MKNPFAFFLAVLALAFASIAVYQKAHANPIYDEALTEDTPGVESGVIGCQDTRLELAIAKCGEVLEKACPLGIRITNVRTLPGTEPGKEGVMMALLCHKEPPKVEGTI